MVIFYAALFQAQGKPTPSAQFPFEFSEGFLWIQVTVPQSAKPLNFLLDTGAGASVINLATAKQLGLKLGRKVPVCGVQTALAGWWPERLSAKVGGFQLPRKYLALDLEKLGQACKRPVDGLIGMDFFRANIVQIDFVAHMVRILKSEHTGNFGEMWPLQVRSDAMCMPITVNGHARQWVRLDTGCATALQWIT